MKQKTIDSFTQLFRVLDRFRARNEDWMFRGQADASWKLVPKAGRPEFEGVDDLELLRHWQKSAIRFAQTPPEGEWDWLTLAQHHGLATRLLDWTINPLAATFFAILSQPEADGAVYCLLADHDSQYLSLLPERIEDIRDARILLPRPISPRVDRQMGRFTIHPNPSSELDLGSLFKITIKAKAKRQLQSDLQFFGVNQSTLFPDLDGLSAYANWFFQTYRTTSLTDVASSKTITATSTNKSGRPPRKSPKRKGVGKKVSKKKRAKKRIAKRR